MWCWTGHVSHVWSVLTALVLLFFLCEAGAQGVARTPRRGPPRQIGPPRPPNQFFPPQPNFGPPPQNFGPPPPNFGPPPLNFGPPPQNFGPPPQNFGPPPPNFGPPPPPNFGPPPVVLAPAPLPPVPYKQPAPASTADLNQAPPLEAQHAGSGYLHSQSHVEQEMEPQNSQSGGTIEYPPPDPYYGPPDRPLLDAYYERNPGAGGTGGLFGGSLGSNLVGAYVMKEYIF